MSEKQTKVVQREPKKKEAVAATKKMVQVTTSVLNMRSGPGFDFPSNGFIPIGDHEVTEIKDGFAKLADGNGWIYLPCTEPVREG